MVLVHLRAVSGTDACAPGIRVDRIAAGTPHSGVLLNPHETPSQAHELIKYDTKRVCWPLPNACNGPGPLGSLYLCYMKNVRY